MPEKTLASSENLLAVLKAYCVQFPSEADRHTSSPSKEGDFPALALFLSLSSFEELYSRKNFQGHLTASAFILDTSGENVLLLHHKSLNKWLQPGGHIDHTDQSVLDAAYREVFEETGIEKENLKLHWNGGSTSIPFDIDSHYIPANSKKDEAAHIHHDFRFLFQLRGETNVAISAAESNNYRWVNLADLRNIEDHSKVAGKILNLRNGFF